MVRGPHTSGASRKLRWFSERSVTGYTSDQRLAETERRLFDLNYGRGLAYDLREVVALNESAFCVLEDSWSTKGAQEFPFGIVIVNSAKIGTMLSDSSVVCIGGSTGGHLKCFFTQ